MFPLFVVIGFVVTGRAAVWVSREGRRRVLPSRWMAWIPLVAPAWWLAGSLSLLAWMAQHRAALEALPIEGRMSALTEGVAQAMEAALAIGVIAGAMLGGSYVFFRTRPLAAEPDEDDAAG